jgi:cellulose synthase/poly-beta-1,6-N-acetylglucosamine synthase-like glycosyltransferase
MLSAFTLLVAVYNIALVLLTCHALGSLLLLLGYLRRRPSFAPSSGAAPPAPADAPFVLVQLPIYNERHVVERLLGACARLDYPRARLLIQVLDDSTDETARLCARLCTTLAAQGVPIVHVHREDRAGYKAGALAHGLGLAPHAAYVAIFDADFLPPRDFLLRTTAVLNADARLGMVQARWGHLNARESLLTRAQSLALDAHFVIEQSARAFNGLLWNFSGTGGMWRAAAIHDAGGWQDATVTEDLDLSYRAQLKGWRFTYLPHIEVPSELPPTLAAYRQQQARWAKGGMQTLRLILPRVWAARSLTLRQKLMATLHLGQYLAHPLMALVLVLTPLLIAAGGFFTLSFGVMGVLAFVPPLMFALSQRALYGDWRARLIGLPFLIVLGTGMTWNNTRAVLAGAFTNGGEFTRTPKYADSARRAPITRRVVGGRLGEIALMLYTAFTTLLALNLAPSFAPYMALYTAGFALVLVMSAREAAAAAPQAAPALPAPQAGPAAAPAEPAAPAADAAFGPPPLTVSARAPKRTTAEAGTARRPEVVVEALKEIG